MLLFKKFFVTIWKYCFGGYLYNPDPDPEKPGPWTQTLKNLDPEKPGSWKTLTLKNLDPEKHEKLLDMKKWLEDHIL